MLENKWNVLLPKRDGRVRAAGPGPWNSAAIGPRRFVGVQLPLCPPMMRCQVEWNVGKGKWKNKNFKDIFLFYKTSCVDFLFLFCSRLWPISAEKKPKKCFFKKNVFKWAIIFSDRFRQNGVKFLLKKNDKWYLSKTPICLSFSRNEVQYNVNRHIHL